MKKYLISLGLALIAKTVLADPTFQVTITEKSNNDTLFSGSSGMNPGDTTPFSWQLMHTYKKTCTSTKGVTECEVGKFATGVTAEVKLVRIEGDKALTQINYNHTKLIAMKKEVLDGVSVEIPETAGRVFKHDNLWVDLNTPTKIMSADDDYGVDVFMAVSTK